MTHYGLAWVLFFSDNREEFFAHADKAIALNSNNPLVLADLGNLFRLAGKREKGLAMTQKAIELNPHHPGWYWLPFSWDNYYHRRDYMEALKFAKLASMPRYESALLVMAAAYGQLGDIDNARAALETLSEVKPGYSMASAREFAARWRIPPEYQEHVIEGLRKAGLSERQAPK
jgi:adenylate cyclase